jgi:hypothetical protein
MPIDLREFYQATDPSRTLFVNNSSDGKYYIDFSSVRGGDILGKLKQKITFFKPNEPTCTLFTGHIGCGKSTKLLRLQAELEKLGFQVVYFESSDDLEMTDVDIADVLLAIARRVSQNLDKLNCHLIYTMPLSLKFSNDYGMLTQRFPEDPKVLPMVPIHWSDGSVHTQGMALMQQMILARAFPDIAPEERLNKVTEIFDSAASLERLCRMSGGHVRDVLRLLNTWIMEEMSLPLTRETLEDVIRSRRNEIMLPISDDEWQLLRHVKERKKVSDDHGYQKLIRSRFVFEYRDGGQSWFDVNPILAEARELNVP